MKRVPLTFYDEAIMGRLPVNARLSYLCGDALDSNVILRGTIRRVRAIFGGYRIDGRPSPSVWVPLAWRAPFRRV